MKKGLAVSPGIGIGKAYIISEPDINIDKGRIDAEQVKEELTGCQGHWSFQRISWS
ncbi:MAG: hypothetical protein KBB40_02165 [Clostridia bacterium]|nr:hypothetical protein [Clostridia bacterium]